MGLFSKKKKGREPGDLVTIRREDVEVGPDGYGIGGAFAWSKAVPGLNGEYRDGADEGPLAARTARASNEALASISKARDIAGPIGVDSRAVIMRDLLDVASPHLLRLPSGTGWWIADWPGRGAILFRGPETRRVSPAEVASYAVHFGMSLGELEDALGVTLARKIEERYAQAKKAQDAAVVAEELRSRAAAQKAAADKQARELNEYIAKRQAENDAAKARADAELKRAEAALAEIARGGNELV